MACKPRPMTLTPTKIPTPTKRISKEGTNEKLCAICQRKFSQHGNYRLITSDFRERIYRVVASRFMPSEFICIPCINELKKIEKMTLVKDKFVNSYNTHVNSLRTKRMASDSPKDRPRAKRSLDMGSQAASDHPRQPLVPALSENLPTPNRRSQLPLPVKSPVRRPGPKPAHQASSFAPDVSTIRNVSLCILFWMIVACKLYLLLLRTATCWILHWSRITNNLM